MTSRWTAGLCRVTGPGWSRRSGYWGQVHDEDEELSSTRFRCFDADTGTWVSTDPLGVAGGLNLYGFDGSPSDVVDPLGLMARKNHPPKSPSSPGAMQKEARPSSFRGSTR
jgi:RHS repeat-associated protein